MKRMRKGIVVLVIAATGAIGVVGTGTNAQAGPSPVPSGVKIVKLIGGGEASPQARGSSWQ